VTTQPSTPRDGAQADASGAVVVLRPDTATFRAIWPIRDETVPWSDLLREAADDIPMIAAAAGARVLTRGIFSIARSVDVPGSGRVTNTILVFEAPARALPRRGYHRRTA